MSDNQAELFRRRRHLWNEEQQKEYCLPSRHDRLQPPPFLRSISDGGDEKAQLDYPTFKKIAAEKSTAIILKYIETEKTQLELFSDVIRYLHDYYMLCLYRGALTLAKSGKLPSEMFRLDYTIGHELASSGCFLFLF